jgi:hypothetical protein
MTTSKTEHTDETGIATGGPAFFAMTDMLRYTATAKDTRFPITELFFDPEQGVLRFVALDVGGWFERREVIVSAQLMGKPDHTTREWPVQISPEAIEKAPEWTDPKTLERMQLAATPFIMVGPFGGQFGAVAPPAPDEAQETTQTPGNLKVDGFERLGDWVGLPVVGQDGDVGTLIDFLFEPETDELSHLVIDTGKILARRQMVVPYDLVFHLAEDGTHVVMNVTEALLRQAPPLEHFDKVSRSWVDTLRTYYQLAPRL